MEASDRLVYRPFREEDRKDLEEIVKYVWNYEPYGVSDETRDRFAALDLNSCLSISNWTEVAVFDGKPVGFLFGRLEEDFPTEKWNEAKSLKRKNFVRLITFKDGRKMIRDNAMYERVNEELLSGCANKDSYDAELVFFALLDGYRGFGIGQHLYQDYLDFLRQREASHLYVFTDTTCNYPFYERNGFTRQNQITAEMQMRNGEQIDMFVYDKKI